LPIANAKLAGSGSVSVAAGGGAADAVAAIRPAIAAIADSLGTAMRVFVTGATGFIGSHVAGQLRERGDEVATLVRSPEKAGELERYGCELVAGDLSDEAAITAGMRDCDAVIHGAAIYEVGIPKSEHGRMYEANVRGTERVLRAALDARIPKVVYVSTIGAYGDTRGEVVDESYQHPGDGYTSYYEETKTEAHQVARRLIDDDGLPCVIVQPGGVYGPADHSALGKQMNDFLAGRMPVLVFPDLGMNMVHVEDVAAGVLLALDNGKPGEAYNLGGEITTMRGLITTLAAVAGKKAPKRALPTGVLKAIAPAGPVIGKLMGQPPNMRELISSGDGVTFWAKHDKAIAELGYSPRALSEGLRDTLAAEGKLAS
jgi:dihydroflavonol-4-reductase